MGNLLAAPITEKTTHVTTANGLRMAVSGMQGWRVEMEDAHCLVGQMRTASDHSLVAVFDGHGGKNAAVFAADHVEDTISDMDEWRTYLEDRTRLDMLSAALTKGFFELDDRMRAALESDDSSGCTAILSIITPTHIVVANTGDSRSVLGTNGQMKPMSYDHKPTNEQERDRIVAAGGVVTWKRVDGDLAVSRALGDFGFKVPQDFPPEKQKVTALPDIEIHERSASDDTLILACDGVWDVLSNEESVQLMRSLMEDGEREVHLLSEELLDHSLHKGSRDNISAVVVLFEGANSYIGDGPGVLARREMRRREEDELRNQASADAGDGPADDGETS